MNFSGKWLPLALAVAMTLTANTAEAKRYLLVWSGDQVLDDGVYGQPDFLAVVDADPKSPTYGSVVNTALMPAVFGRDFTTHGDAVKPGCISWERTTWPHGRTGNASPHAMTFIDVP